MSEKAEIQAKADRQPALLPGPTGLLQRRKGLGPVAEECCNGQLLQRNATDHTEPKGVPPTVREMLHLPGQPLDPESRAFMEPRLGQDFSRVPVRTDAKAPAQDSFLSPTVRKVIAAGGSSLEPAFRREAEQRFGQDLTGVRVHTDPDAARSAEALNAEAYTCGNHIAFAQGRYRPGSDDGQQVLAHELAHVVQQRRGGARLPSFARSNSKLEEGAQHAASAFSSGRGLIEVQGASLPGVARLPRSLHQDLNPPALRDNELKTEINEIQNWLRANKSPTPDRKLLEQALKDLQAEAAKRPTTATRGTVAHTGTIGTGATKGTIEARTDEEVQVGGGKGGNIIAIDYAGANAPNARWLQFVWFEMSVVSPTVTGRITGNIPTTSGTKPFTTTPASPSWSIDSANGISPYYIESGGAGARDAALETMFDRPGGTSVAPLFQSALQAVAKATSATFTAHFSTYLLIDNEVKYLVPWTAATTATVAGNTATIADVAYTVGAAGAASKIPANLLAILNKEYPYTKVK